MRFAAVASASEAMVWESVTDGTPSVDADESKLRSRRRVDRTKQTVQKYSPCIRRIAHASDPSLDAYFAVNRASRGSK